MSPRRKPAPSGAVIGPPDASAILQRLSQLYPGATTELHYRTPFELLVATMLSAQSTDARVNQVTPALFERFPSPQALAAASLPDVEALVQPTGFFRTKARAIVSMSSQLLARHGGEVPRSMEALVELSGVGRKTANVVLGHALGVPGLPVDRHVTRVATRIGLTSAQTPERIEQELGAQVAPVDWTLLSDCLILHGRRICRPRPACAKCAVSDACLFYRTALPGGVPATGGPPRSPGRSAASKRKPPKPHGGRLR